VHTSATDGEPMPDNIAGWGPIPVNTTSNNSRLPGLAVDLDLDTENGSDLIVCRLQKVSDDIQKIVESEVETDT
jgi:hypothetical protein